MFDLPTIWAALISLALLAYVVLDGFDLGIGILFGFWPHQRTARHDDEHRRARLGRQRNLAGPWGRRSFCRFPRWPIRSC